MGDRFIRFWMLGPNPELRIARSKDWYIALAGERGRERMLQFRRKGKEDNFSLQQKLLLSSLANGQDTPVFGTKSVEAEINGIEIHTTVGMIPSFDESYLVREKILRGELVFDAYNNRAAYIEGDLLHKNRRLLSLLLLSSGLGARCFNSGVRSARAGAGERKLNLPPSPIPESFVFTFYLELTTRCNLACRYCWAEGGRREIIELDKNRARKVSELIRRFSRSAGRKVNVNFEGRGEPLLNLEAMKEIVENSAENVSGFALLTNATLLEGEALDFVAERDIRISASLDFNEESHNACRVYRNGKGSFARVLKNLRKAVREGVRVSITATATSLSRDYHRMVDIARELGCSSIGLRPCWISGSAGEELAVDAEVFAREYAELTRRRFKLMEKGIVLRERKVDDFLASLMFGREIANQRGCGAGSGIIALTADLEVYRCNHYPKDFYVGNLEEVAFEDFVKVAKEMEGRYPNNPEFKGMDNRSCFYCPYKSLCRLGCFDDERRYGYSKCIDFCRYALASGKRILEMVIEEGFLESEEFVGNFAKAIGVRVGVRTGEGRRKREEVKQ
ncbi:MAG: hypothetical protein DRN28_05100 [Thermoplasmata archaeon]|nr:MAG: hypothetical protein DRN28_05100 [Thermoplasmata archaeon]